MFTGLVEAQGQVSAIEPEGDAMRLSIHAPEILDDASVGDSISVNGVCLTAAEIKGGTFTADVMAETLNRTGLARLGVGSRVNLERAVAVGQRLGGHLVQGHVDGTSELIERTSSQHWDILRFSLDPQLVPYVVEKGSIAIDGTSLTVSQLGEDWFEVSLIPTTLAETTHGELQVGQIVNIEVDVLAKYVEKQLRRPDARAETSSD